MAGCTDREGPVALHSELLLRARAAVAATLLSPVPGARRGQAAAAGEAATSKVGSSTVLPKPMSLSVSDQGPNMLVADDSVKNLLRLQLQHRM